MTTPVVIVERINAFGVKPDYCVHGETFCIECKKACWLGSETVKLVMDGTLPLCTVCAGALADMNLMPKEGPVDHVHDHRRADGPH